jgi:predicted RNA binding protein YcfA (HicA-like mRNA interferase family)
VNLNPVPSKTHEGTGTRKFKGWRTRHLHVVVPQHSGDLAPKTLKSIIVQTEMTVEEFIALL